MATFILIHGAMHGGWCWDRLTPLLEAAGHRVLAPDLPGMGADRSVPLAAITLAGWADFVAGLARDAETPVILVGHSRGGLVIGEAAELAAERIAGLVYLTAILVPPGKSAPEMEGETLVHLPMVFNADHTAFTVSADDAPGIFYHRCAPADAERAISQLGHEPLAPIMTRTSITPGRWGRIPRAYIQCADDRIIPLGGQQAMHAEWTCDPVLTLDADHSPFLSAPEALAEALLSIEAAFAG